MVYVLGAFGILVTIGGVVLIRWGLASTRWPTTTGVVLSAEVESNLGSHSSTSFRPKIVYEYQVQGERYESSRFSFKHFVQSRSATPSQKIIARYAVGSEVKVHYHPTKPKEAVLIPGVGTSTFVLLIIGLSITVFSAFKLLETMK